MFNLTFVKAMDVTAVDIITRYNISRKQNKMMDSQLNRIYNT